MKDAIVWVIISCSSVTASLMSLFADNRQTQAILVGIGISLAIVAMVILISKVSEKG